MSFLYVKVPGGRTFKLDVKSEPVEWPSTSEQKNDAKVETNTYTATLTFKIGKRMRAKIQWAMNGCKTRKEYRRFKKQRKRLNKDLKIIYSIKNLDNQKVVKSLKKITKFLKNTKT